MLHIIRAQHLRKRTMLHLTTNLDSFLNLWEDKHLYIADRLSVEQSYKQWTSVIIKIVSLFKSKKRSSVYPNISLVLNCLKFLLFIEMLEENHTANRKPS